MVKRDCDRKTKFWTFTLPNYTEEELDKISGWDVEYLIYGFETCPKTKTPHLQGYVIWHEQKRRSALKKLNKRIHWEEAIMDPETNRAYCSKEDKNPFEKGQIPYETTKRPNGKKVLESDEVNGGKRLATQRILYGMELEETMMKEIMDNKLEKPEIIYVHGPTGSGKTYWALQHALLHWGYKNVATVKFDKNGFCHCNDPQRPCLVWCEFRPSCLDAASFLELTDGYGCHLNVKHGSMFIRPKAIYICSILDPSEIYKEEINKQFVRRMTKIINKGVDPYIDRTEDSDDESTIELASENNSD